MIYVRGGDGEVMPVDEWFYLEDKLAAVYGNQVVILQPDEKTPIGDMDSKGYMLALAFSMELGAPIGHCTVGNSEELPDPKVIFDELHPQEDNDEIIVKGVSIDLPGIMGEK